MYKNKHKRCVHLFLQYIMKTLVLVLFAAVGAFSFPQDIGGGILHDVGLNSNVPIKTNVEEVADPASLDPGKPSDAGEVLDQGLSLENLASISEFHDIAQNLDSGLLDNLLGIVAQILLPFLGTLQELLDNLTGALIGGLIASLKTLLEQLISSSVSI